MITYDNISYRIAEVFQTRRMKPNSETSESSGMHDPPYDGVISQEWGDAPLTTVLNNRPVTFLTWYEHLDGAQPGYIHATPKSGESPIKVSLYNAGPYMDNNSGGSNLSLGHTAFDPGANLHWETFAVRNFPGRDENWVLSVNPLSRRNSLFSEPVSTSMTSKTSASGAISTTRFELYKSVFSLYSGYQWDSNVGPFLALDRVLEDDELHSLTMNPWPYLRKYWSDVMFLVSPLTGEDFGPRQWHFEATYGDNSSSVASGYVPYLDYSTRAVRGLVRGPYYPSSSEVLSEPNAAVRTRTVPAATVFSSTTLNSAVRTRVAPNLTARVQLQSAIRNRIVPVAVGSVGGIIRGTVSVGVEFSFGTSLSGEFSKSKSDTIAF